MFYPLGYTADLVEGSWLTLNILIGLVSFMPGSLPDTYEKFTWVLITERKVKTRSKIEIGNQANIKTFLEAKLGRIKHQKASSRTAIDRLRVKQVPTGGVIVRVHKCHGEWKSYIFKTGGDNYFL